MAFGQIEPAFAGPLQTGLTGIPQPIAALPGGTQLAPAIAQAAPVPGQIGVNPNLVDAGVPQTGFTPPPIGLIGSELALQGTLAGALDAISQGAQGARSSISAGRGGATSAIRQGVEQARADIGLGIEESGALAQQAAGLFDPFTGGGGQAFQQQLALSGALGGPAQETAFQQFRDSPGQQFLREQGEQSLLRNAAAVGGLGGGRVRQELQRQGIGFAEQAFQNAFDRLGSLSQTGLAATGQQAGVFGDQASRVASLRGQGAGITGNLQGTLAGALASLGGQGAGLAQQAGLAGANVFQNIGSQVSQGRLGVGSQLAQQVGGTGSALSALLSGQGTGVSDIIGGGTSQIAQLLTQLGLGTSGQIAGLQGLPGLQAGQGILSGIGQLASGVGTAIDAFGSTAAPVETVTVG